MDNRANAKRTISISLLGQTSDQKGEDMGFSFEEFPSSDYYDSDLREILAYIRKITNYIKSYDEVIAELQTELQNIQGLYTRVDAIENSISDLNVIRQNIANLSVAVNNLNNEDVVLQNQINELKSQLGSINSKFNDVYEYIDTTVASINANWYHKWLQLQNLINTRYYELFNMFEELEAKFNEVLENLSYDVYNPISTTRMSFDENNRRVYVDLRDSGMTYGELSARQFTYGYIRDARWRHRLFSTKGRRYVTLSDVNSYSPISGRWTNWSEALSHAIGTIFNTLTYGQLAVKAMTYSEIAELTYIDLIRMSDRSALDYEDLSELTVNGKNLICF